MKQKDIVLNGIAASSGIAVGKVFLLEEDVFSYSKVEIPQDKVESEILKLKKAIEKTRKELELNKDELNKVLGKNYAKIADAHLLILKDSMFIDNVINMIKKGNNVEYSIHEVVSDLSKTFDLIDDEYFRERKHDFLNVTKKILKNLLDKTKKTLFDLEEDSVVVAQNLTPADTVKMKENIIKGFVTEVGGKTSHTALVAQSLEIPAVVGLKDITCKVEQGMPIIIDGDLGLVILSPSDKTISNYKRKYEKQITNRKDLEKLRDFPAVTLDGKEVVLGANIEKTEEVKSALNHGAKAIGLYRSEFMYLSRKTMPTEEEHYQNYSNVAKKMMPYDVIIRTIDLGGDKIARLGLMNISRETNPFMGLRAIRFCLKYPEIFKTQLKGILRASVYGKIKIMYPMISRVSEIQIRFWNKLKKNCFKKGNLSKKILKLV